MTDLAVDMADGITLLQLVQAVGEGGREGGRGGLRLAMRHNNYHRVSTDGNTPAPPSSSKRAPPPTLSQSNDESAETGEPTALLGLP